MSLRYPVAANPDAALQAPLGFALRELEARQIAAGETVSFVTEWAGPAWPTEAAARGAYEARLAGEHAGWWTILPVAAPAPGAKGRTRRHAPLKPVFRDGKRWPTLGETERMTTAWRLSIRYWRVGEAVSSVGDKAARKLRRDPTAAELEAREIHRLAEQPLRPDGPQRALDIGLFEMRPPEAPHIIMPDE